MNEPAWQRLWRCPYCQNVIADSVMMPVPQNEYTNDGDVEGASDYMECPCCRESSYVPED